MIRLMIDPPSKRFWFSAGPGVVPGYAKNTSGRAGSEAHAGCRAAANAAVHQPQNKGLPSGVLIGFEVS
jgi:hypothetical protein